MKSKLLLILSIILTFAFSAAGDENERNFIIDSMEFPSPGLSFGTLLSDPFFTLNIENTKADYAEIENKIKVLESESNSKIDPVELYQLGNLYKAILNYGKATKYYKKYLESTDATDYNNIKDKDMFLLKGEIYYSLSETDQSYERIENIERSLVYFTKAFDLEPSSHLLWIKIGDCYLSLGKNSEAIYCYNKYMEKNKSDYKIYPRLQAAIFQLEYAKLMEVAEIDNLAIGEGFDFSYIETAINNANPDDKEFLKLQHHIYLVRLLLFKKEYYRIKILNEKDSEHSNLNNLFTKEEERIIDDTNNLILKMVDREFTGFKFKYLSGIINYLKNNYKESISDLNKISKNDVNFKKVYNEVIFISLFLLNENIKTADLIKEIIKTNPQPEHYLILGSMEFQKGNIDKALMLCNQALKIDEGFSEAYSGLSVLYAVKENYLAADEMIKKGNFLLNRDERKKSILFYQIKVNEAAIALLKNEKERAYILLRSVSTTDNNRKAMKLYNRYFTKK